MLRRVAGTSCEPACRRRSRSTRSAWTCPLLRRAGARRSRWDIKLCRRTRTRRLGGEYGVLPGFTHEGLWSSAWGSFGDIRLDDALLKPEKYETSAQTT